MKTKSKTKTPKIKMKNGTVAVPARETPLDREAFLAYARQREHWVALLRGLRRLVEMQGRFNWKTLVEDSE